MRRLTLVNLAIFVIWMCASTAFGASIDLVMDPDSVTFSDESPMEGDPITISVILSNQGTDQISVDVDVRFVEGDPAKGSLQIGSDAIVLRESGGIGRVEIKWRAAPGKTDVYIIADPDNLVEETNEDNNTVVKTIEGRKWEGAKATKEQIKESINKGVDWLKSQQGEFYVTCPDGHDNFLYSALGYGKCIMDGASLEGIDPRRISGQLLFTLKPELQDHLNNGKASEELQKEFENNQFWLSPEALVSTDVAGERWLIKDEESRQVVSVKREQDELKVYREEFMPGGWMAEIGPGMTSLVVMTMLYAGADESDPAVQNGIEHLFKQAPVTWYNWTDPYEYASGILALTCTGNKEKYMEQVEFAIKKLAQLQTEDGGWGYGAVADAAHLQYVMFGLYAAKQWGVDIPADVWTKAVAWLTGMQEDDGGWNYYSGGSGPFAEGSYGSMTATAVMGLKAAGVPPTAKSVRRGIEWLEKYYSITRNPGSFYWHYYYLVALQRAMDVTPTQNKLGKYDWYSEIANFLVSRQQDDGSWLAATPIYTTPAAGQAPTIASWGAHRGDVMATAFAVLFLSRATPRSAAPDVGLAPQSIMFSKSDPDDGEQVTITASVSNGGATPIENLEVRFYDGPPEGGGAAIGTMQTLVFLSRGETKEVSVTWKAVGAGGHRIYAVVDPDNSVRESDEGNNIAYGQISVGGESAPAIPAMVKVGDGLYKLGNLDLDLNSKTITMSGEVNMSYGLIELLACTRIGKLHESALVMDVQPIHLQTALILLGLEYGGGMRYQGDPLTPKGDRVRIWVEWDANNQTERHRAEELVFDRVKQSQMESTDWVFTGSRMNNGAFMAQAVGTLITTFRDPDAIIDNPLPEGADDTVYIVNSQVTPPKGTDIRMIITPANSS
ncbi:YdjY domain-containing protein [Candidatus Poribacteria bacterium]